MQATTTLKVPVNALRGEVKYRFKWTRTGLTVLDWSETPYFYADGEVLIKPMASVTTEIVRITAPA